jgi:hypothetical protein
MSYVIKSNKYVAALLSAVMAFALSGNAMAGFFCPHIAGRNSCAQSSSSETAKTGQMDHTHMHHERMSEMDMADHAMHNQADGEPSKPSAPSEIAVTQKDEQCSHCMMHSQSTSTYYLRVVVQNSPSYQVIADELPAQILISDLASPGFVELHEHGPPGERALLYVLVSSFRI